VDYIGAVTTNSYFLVEDLLSREETSGYFTSTISNCNSCKSRLLYVEKALGRAGNPPPFIT